VTVVYLLLVVEYIGVEELVVENLVEVEAMPLMAIYDC
jgi:hypothetical protein